MTRREWEKLALGGFLAAALCNEYWGQTRRINSRFKGVLIGVQSYSFREFSLDGVIKAMLEIGIGSCELTQRHIEPRARLSEEAKMKKLDPRELFRRWRLTVSMDEFKAIRAKFDRNGLTLSALAYGIRDDFTDAEIERVFEMARALGLKIITSSANISAVRRIDPWAQRYKIRVGLHNHSEIKANEFATPDDFARGLDGASEYIAINLDIGHLTAANFDAAAFLRLHHERIVSLHIKDRKRNQGPHVPFGEGDAPIRPVLALLRQNRWPIPANIEYEYEGKDAVEEVKRCFAYCKQVLNA